MTAPLLGENLPAVSCALPAHPPAGFSFLGHEFVGIGREPSHSPTTAPATPPTQHRRRARGRGTRRGHHHPREAGARARGSKRGSEARCVREVGVQLQNLCAVQVEATFEPSPNRYMVTTQRRGVAAQRQGKLLMAVFYIILYFEPNGSPASSRSTPRSSWFLIFLIAFMVNR